MDQTTLTTLTPTTLTSPITSLSSLSSVSLLPLSSTQNPITLWSDAQVWKSSNQNDSSELSSGGNPAPYFGDQLYQFKQEFIIWHGYLSLIICGFGLITNILNIIVLTR